MKSNRILFLFFIISFSVFLVANEGVPKFKSNKHNLSVCAVFKNEAKYLKEWIEFHRLVGVDHFFLYNIGSTDRYMDVLKSYVKEGIVTLIQWPDLSKHQKDEIWALGTQIPAYENAIKLTAIGKTKWLVFVDIDEFLLPVDGNNLNEVVERYKEYPGIILSRLFFDASRGDPLPKRNLVIESIEMTASPKINSIKTIENVIFKPELCTCFTWPPYHFIFKNGQAPVTLYKWEMRINHYMNRNQRSVESKRFKDPIQMDYRRFEQEIEGLLEAGYEVEDHAIDRFVPVLWKKMGY